MDGEPKTDFFKRIDIPFGSETQHIKFGHITSKIMHVFAASALRCYEPVDDRPYLNWPHDDLPLFECEIPTSIQAPWQLLDRKGKRMGEIFHGEQFASLSIPTREEVFSLKDYELRVPNELEPQNVQVEMRIVRKKLDGECSYQNIASEDRDRIVRAMMLLAKFNEHMYRMRESSSQAAQDRDTIVKHFPKKEEAAV